MSRSLIGITGGSGFLGRHLVLALSLRGRPARLIDTVRPAADRPFPWGLGGIAGWEFATGDVTDRGSLDAALAGLDGVVHLAGISSASVCRARPLEAFRANALGTANVLDACAQGGGPRVVLASSRHVEAGAEGLDPYAASKAAAETWVRAAGQVVARFDNIYGPGQGMGAVIPDFIARGLAEGSPARSGTAGAVPLLFVDDAVDAVIRLLENGQAGGVYRVRGPAEAPLAEVAALVGALIGKESPPAVSPCPSRDADPSLAALGWRARVAWPDGVARTFEAWGGGPGGPA